jgi:spermidine synthase
VTSPAVVIERFDTPRGELVLRRVGDDYEVISNGTFLMDTRSGESERLLVTAALAAHSHPRDVLIGGLGVGFSVAAAIEDERVTQVVAVEIEPKVIEWNRTHLAPLNHHVLDRPRVEVVRADLIDRLRTSDQSFDVICLDIDNGPQWTVTEANLRLYEHAGTALVASRLRPGGICSIWGAARSPSYEAVLAAHFAHVEVIEIPVVRGDPDVVILASLEPSPT